MNNKTLTDEELEQFIEALNAFLPTPKQIDFMNETFPIVRNNAEYTQKVVAALNQKQTTLSKINDALSFIAGKWEETKQSIDSFFQVHEYGYLDSLSFARGDDNDDMNEHIYIEYNEDDNELYVYAKEDMHFTVEINHIAVIADEIEPNIFIADTNIYIYKEVEANDDIKIY